MQIRVKEGVISVGFGWRCMCVERERELRGRVAMRVGEMGRV
jgi:hypothetical protein